MLLHIEVDQPVALSQPRLVAAPHPLENELSSSTNYRSIQKLSHEQYAKLLTFQCYTAVPAGDKANHELKSEASWLDVSPKELPDETVCLLSLEVLCIACAFEKSILRQPQMLQVLLIFPVRELQTNKMKRSQKLLLPNALSSRCRPKPSLPSELSENVSKQRAGQKK